MWERIKKAWQILWYGYYKTNDGIHPDKLNGVLGDLHTIAVKRAMKKMEDEPQSENRFSFSRDASGEEKRKEVQQWAKYYGTKLGIKDYSNWKYNFAIEYFVGVKKGYL